MRFVTQRTHFSPRTFTVLGSLAVILYILVQLTLWYRGGSGAIVGTTSSRLESLSLGPGELPGYTGWARPEYTLAGAFVLEHPSDNPLFVKFDTRSGTTTVEWQFSCQERLSADCADSHAWFYVRAYGPAIVTGVVRRTGSVYTASATFLDPGIYTVEVVVTVSQAPDIAAYPRASPEVYYEGYLLPDFPVTLHVMGDPTATDRLTWCELSDLVLPLSDVGDGITALSKARWKVTDMVRHHSHAHTTVTPANSITLQAYRWGYNSLGIRCAYQYRDCHLLPSPTPQYNPLGTEGNESCLSNGDTVHVVFIGDSTMRLQKTVFEQHFAATANAKIKVDFYELYGGTLLTQSRTGPDLKKAAASMSPNDPRFILFNTGLHDIHRLCAAEFAQERTTYLQPQPEKPCTEQYKSAIQVLLDAVNLMPGTKVFQTTTAGWPKYGNFGVNWDPRYGQPLPLEAGFIEEFNKIAVSMVRATGSIDVVDGYWIGAARPDNREVGEHAEIGNKLSHPGTEVVMAMVRIWTMTFVLKFCGNVPDHFV